MPSDPEEAASVDRGAIAREHIVLALSAGVAHAFLGLARTAVESMLRDVYAREVKRDPPERIAIEGLLNHREMHRAVPEDVRAHVGTIQKFGNMGSHASDRAPSEWTLDDIRSAQSAFGHVVRWYYREFRKQPTIPEDVRLLLPSDAQSERPPDDRIKRDRDLLGQKYRVDSQLGEGGTAVVYRAHDTQLDRAVALKVLKQERLVDIALVGRMRREARNAFKLTHPHVLRVHDIGELRDGRPFLVMDIAEGGTLEERIRANKPDTATAMRWARQLLSALVFIHEPERGIIHRDVKPTNVLLNAAGDVLLSDFGIAEGTEHTRFTRSDDRLGTPGYMAPECHHSPEAVTAKADVYSAARVIQYVLTGKPSPLGKNVSVRLGALLLRMGSDEPDERPTAAAALAELGESAPAEAPPRSATLRMPASDAAEVPLATALVAPRAAQASGRGASPPAWVYLVAGGVLMLSVGVAFAAWTYPTGRSDEASPKDAVDSRAPITQRLGESGPASTAGLHVPLATTSDLEAAAPASMPTTSPGAAVCAGGSGSLTISAGALTLLQPHPRHQWPKELANPVNADVPAFCISAHPITASDYSSCIAQGACLKPKRLCNLQSAKTMSLPMNCIEHDEAETYCRANPKGGGLPSLVEFERALRERGKQLDFPRSTKEWAGDTFPAAALQRGPAVMQGGAPEFMVRGERLDVSGNEPRVSWEREHEAREDIGFRCVWRL